MHLSVVVALNGRFILGCLFTVAVRTGEHCLVTRGLRPLAVVLGGSGSVRNSLVNDLHPRNCLLGRWCGYGLVASCCNLLTLVPCPGVVAFRGEVLRAVLVGLRLLGLVLATVRPRWFEACARCVVGVATFICFALGGGSGRVLVAVGAEVVAKAVIAVGLVGCTSRVGVVTGRGCANSLVAPNRLIAAGIS